MLSNNLFKFLITCWLLLKILNINEGLCSSSTVVKSYITKKPKVFSNPSLTNVGNRMKKTYDIEIIEYNATQIMQRQEGAGEQEVEIEHAPEEESVIMKFYDELSVEAQPEFVDKIVTDVVNNTLLVRNELESNFKEEENMEHTIDKNISIIHNESASEKSSIEGEKNALPNITPLVNIIPSKNHTNTFKKPDSCYACNSSSNGNCSGYTHTPKVYCNLDDATVEISKGNTQKHAGCFTMIDDINNTTVRGCIDELNKDGLRYCLTHKQYCAICFSNNCNSMIAHNSFEIWQMNRILFVLILSLNII